MRPWAADLFCGLGGWTEGLLAEGYDVTGYDIEAHEYGDQKYPATLVLRDVLTIHGSEFKDAALIVASPPCQEYSYMAMPFSRGKKIAAALRGQGEFPDGYTGSRTIEELNRLFNACFRIQREASEAAGRHVPMVVENVKGAQPWVGKARAHFGSFFLWGNVDMVGDRVIAGGLRWESVRAAKQLKGKTNFHFYEQTGKPSPSWHGIETEKSVALALEVQDGRKVPGIKLSDVGFNVAAAQRYREENGQKTTGHVNKRDGHGHTRHLTNQRESDAVKQPGLSGPLWFDKGAASMSSKSNSRKAASAQIAKIPFALSSYIARAYFPCPASK